MKQDLLKGLSKEQIAKLRECKSQEEIIALAKQEGIELTDEQLEAVNGGFCSDDIPSCPKCGSKHVNRLGVYDGVAYDCRECNYSWTIRYDDKR